MSKNPVQFATRVIYVEPADIFVFKAVVESYDNLVTLRTEDPKASYLRIWFDLASSSDVDELLEFLSGKLRLRIVEPES